MTKFLDLEGKEFGKLTAICRIEDGEKGYAKWLCRCECGGEIVVNTKQLQRGTITNCGCIPKKSSVNGNIAEDLRGRRFGMLTVIRRVENRGDRVAWLCKCDCGKETVCTARDLKKGYVKSCGCMKRKKNRWYRNIKGKQFGQLVALYPTLNRNAKGSILWKCLCDCGNNCYVSEDTLVNGSTKSCGCRKDEVQQEVFKNISFYDGTSYTLLKFRKKARADNRSGYRGITLKNNGRYKAHIGFQGKTYRLGTYDNLQEALEMRKYAESILHEGFCDAFERWKELSKDNRAWEEENPLIYDVKFKDKEFTVRCNIQELEKRYLEANEGEE